MKNLIVRLFFLAFGAFIAGFGLEGFLIPNSMIDGGIVGISIMLSYLTKVNLGVLILCINIPFIFLALQKLGKIFVAQTLFAITMLAIGVNFFHGHIATDDILLATIFGGVVLGIGVGIVLRNNAAMDGTEILSIRLSKKLGFSIGEIIMFFNIFIYTCAGFLYGWDKAMYSVLVYFITYKVIDIVLEGLNEAKSVTIISDKAEEIGNDIIKKLDVGVTYIDGKGGYTGTDKKIIYCVISRLEIAKLKDLIKFIDKTAFLAIENVHEVEGVRIKEKKAKRSLGKSIFHSIFRKRKKS
ncbi:MAG: YitT family protein [Candidatus Gastranaerophilaceae bacterium]